MLFIEQSNNSAATNIDNYINNLIELTKQPLYDNRITSTLIDNRKRLEQKNHLISTNHTQYLNQGKQAFLLILIITKV